ncbi:gas vesicle protein GvpJ [Citricoccus sp. GCM10030269]|uniref:gas vesicle protein GvpJ n=1 Tax=Citricoccus sp. GCM10030269 TaxID=3273388 RepID=UPI00360ACC6F
MSETTDGAGTGQGRSGTEPSAMEPTRNPQVTLPDLIGVLLNKGTYLNLDLIIAVADIPLIGINLRATIAGMETMLEYGMMRDWDERTRAWVQQSVSRHVPLRSGEEIIAKMAGGHFQEGFSRIWRPGALYVTDQRLFAFRRDPHEVLWEAELDDIAEIGLQNERTIGGEDRTRVVVQTSDGTSTLLSASSPETVRDLVSRQRGLPSGEGRTPPQEAEGPLLEGELWYLEQRAGGPIWRGGTARMERYGPFTWQGALDTRPAVSLQPQDIHGIQLARGRTPGGHAAVLRLATEHGSVDLAGQNLDAWTRAFAEITGHEPSTPDDR